MRYGNVIRLDMFEQKPEETSMSLTGLSLTVGLNRFMQDLLKNPNIPKELLPHWATYDSYSEVLSDWVIVNPDNSKFTQPVKFGDTILLQSSWSAVGAPHYLSVGESVSTLDDFPMPAGARAVSVAPGTAPAQQWLILDPNNLSSTSPVKFGDVIALAASGDKNVFLRPDSLHPFTQDVRAWIAPNDESLDLLGKLFWVIGKVDLAMGSDLPPDFDSVINFDQPQGSALLILGSSTQETIANLAGKIPEVGGVIGGLLKIFWPAPDTDIWKMIENQVKALIKDIVFEDKLQGFKEKLNGVKELLEEYVRTPNSQEKSEKIEFIASSLVIFRNEICDPAHPEKTLPYLVANGSLEILARREIYVHYEEFFPNDPDHKGKKQALVELQTAIDFYTQAARTARDNIINTRMGYIKFDFLEEQVQNILYLTWTFSDSYVGKTIRWKGGTTGHPDAEAQANAYNTTYRQQVDMILRERLESYLSPVYLWPYMNPEYSKQEAPLRVTAEIHTGPYWSPDDIVYDAAGGPITNIAMRVGEYVDGLEVSYGGKPGGWHGGNGGNFVTLQLEEGETIVAVHGRSGEYVDALHFETSNGKTVGGGLDGGNEWSAKLPLAVDPVLLSIGARSSSLLETIILRWQYKRWI